MPSPQPLISKFLENPSLHLTFPLNLSIARITCSSRTREIRLTNRTEKPISQLHKSKGAIFSKTQHDISHAGPHICKRRSRTRTRAKRRLPD
ncbi:hypothetical protein EUGRSUZ_G01443 [Eucalyptus grandis]|uniref:Uncharacterized protein n=2 Tax=Eucalyptus grandis TaxID=71139 RepID=A0ACC3K2Y9_EUCGR|nr:hypothetical protein EUGRSUZ_G01443 [Eucalyptus grandis]